MLGNEYLLQHCRLLFKPKAKMSSAMLCVVLPVASTICCTSLNRVWWCRTTGWNLRRWTRTTTHMEAIVRWLRAEAGGLTNAGPLCPPAPTSLRTGIARLTTARGCTWSMFTWWSNCSESVNQVQLWLNPNRIFHFLKRNQVLALVDSLLIVNNAKVTELLVTV